MNPMHQFTEPTIIIISASFLLAAGLIGGVIPQYIKLSDRGLHHFLALGTGMLLGTIFYHMLPEALEEFSAITFVLIGLLGVYVVERMVVAESFKHTHLPPESTAENSYSDDHTSHDHESHSIIGVTAFAGLSVHALLAGFGLSTQLGDPVTAVPLMTSMLVHKLSEAFSLSTILLLANYPKSRSLIMMGIFSLITPFGIAAGGVIMGFFPEGLRHAAAGLAAGTFLYVAVCDLLPEVFHRRKGRWGSLVMLVIGIALIASMMSGGHHH